MLNVVVIGGRATAEPELKKTQSGKSVVNFTVAVDRRGKDKGTDFIRCVAWEKTAELISQMVHKGERVIVTGRIQVTQYEQEGKKRSAVDVVADSFDVVEPKKMEAPKEETQPELVTLPAGDDLPF